MMPEPKSPRDLRSFGLIIAGASVLFGLWPRVVRSESPRVWVLGVGAVFALAALAAPGILRHPYRVWMLLGHGLGWVNSRIIMTVLFFLVVTPAALVMRIAGRDALMRRLDPDATTYRVVREPRPATHMKHPF
jgi:hypothetical protein